MSDLPVWVGAAGAVGQALAGVGQLYLGIRAARHAAAAEFGRLLDEMLDLPPDEISSLLGDDRLSEIVGYAWEAAARTASEDKRWILARVAVTALKGESDDAELDPLRMLLRTIDALDEPHIRLLVLIATQPVGNDLLAGTALEGFARVDDLERRWLGASGLVRPMLAVLVRENLIEDRGLQSWDFEPAYGVSAYGRRFLRYLPGEPLAELEQARLTITMTSTTEILVRNVGLSTAKRVVICGPANVEGVSLFEDGEPPEPFDLEADKVHRSAIRPPSSSHPLPHEVDVVWTDIRGEESRRFTVGRER